MNKKEDLEKEKRKQIEIDAVDGLLKDDGGEFLFIYLLFLLRL